MAASKKCFRCGRRKRLTSFYRHREMADGRLNKCKACTKTDVILNARGKPALRSAYESRRTADPVRKAKAAERAARNKKKWPGKFRARHKVSNGLRDGRLRKEPCETCGTRDRVEAHHNDYRRPLVITWLCFLCHAKTHRKAA